jgi:hypothetical protein
MSGAFPFISAGADVPIPRVLRLVRRRVHEVGEVGEELNSRKIADFFGLFSAII